VDALAAVPDNSCMSELQRIVTHPGGAHKDDLLACCVLIAKYGCPIVRRDPTDEELADASIAIVDIGGSHDPALQNFDHHHFPREHPPTCSLSLVLDALGLYEDAMKFCDWLEPAEWFDSRGPNKTAEWLGVPRRAVSQLNSPVDMTLLRRFAGQPEHAAGETLYEYMRFVGQDLIDYLRDVRVGIEQVTKVSERWSVAVGDDVIETVFVPPASKLRSVRLSIPTVAAKVMASVVTRTIRASISPNSTASRTFVLPTRVASCARLRRPTRNASKS
jgi:hypothetical protein